MTRAIKFRAWDKNRKVMIDRVLAGPGDPCSMVWDDEMKWWANFDEHCGTIMQYTGVHDDAEEQNEIYEGDIVAFEFDGKTIKGKVKYEGGAFLLVSDAFLDGFILFTEIHEFDRSYCWLRDTQVIGNIYEHPELLKEGE